MRNRRGLAVAVASFLLASSAAFHGYADDFEIPTQESKTREEFAKYREAAWAHFRKRCKEDAGERIVRIVDDVNGLLLLRRRQYATDFQLRDQYWRGDPYGHDSMLPDSEIRNFLRDLDERDLPTLRQTSRPGYPYVETKEADGYRRYQLDETRSKITETTVEGPASQFGVNWEDISTDEDRKYWVAGGRLRIINLSTNEILAERIGYLIEPGFGSDGGGRRPWLHARLVSSDRAACPPFRPRSLVPINRLFVEKVLKPRRSN